MNQNPAMTPPSRDTTVAPEAARFVAGYVLAGRYRMITLLGRGGMGEVWRADDLALQTPVAVKLIRSIGPEARERILNEVRLAREITHPAVCRVFDVGESGGEVFYTMEVVRGENLATLVRRLGRLPSEKVVDICEQLCGGLAAAHTRGILHRDLKPANVLIDENGLVRITDFGIAGYRGGPEQTLMGTPGYMAPEQLRPGIPLSERTDLYALGLILYELVVGRPAYEFGASPPPRPSALVEDVDPRLERAIVKCVSPEPADRPASVLEVTRMLAEPAGRPASRRFPMAFAAAAALAIALALLYFLFFRTPAGARLTAQDTIILSDFTNSTGEPVFDGALKVALAVALEQSPFLKIFPDERVRETLRLMQRPPGEPITQTIAREVARREQLKALVTGSISSLGTHYVVAIEAINAASGEVLAREQVEVAAKEQVLASLGAATSRLRSRLGESLATIKQFDVPLAQATTPSLDALHAYSLALDQGRMVPRLEAIPHLQRAIDLDPNFAMAHALLSGVYANTGRSAEAPAYSRRAFELRDRVSERERFFISWRYYIDAQQAWDKAYDLALGWTRTYPREAFAFNSLAIAAAAFGRHTQAVSALEEAIRLDERFVPPHGNLAGSLIALNEFGRAGALVRQAAARGRDTLSVHRMGYVLAFLDDDLTGMVRELEAVSRTPEAIWASNWEARTSAFAGRIRAAHALYQRSARAAVASRFQELGAQWTIEDAELHALAGQCDEARREIDAGLELSRDNFSLERAGRALALCGRRSESSRLAEELRQRFSDATLTVRIQLPVMAAAGAVADHQFARALELLDPVKPYDFAPAAEFWPAYLRGTAYLELEDAPAATAQFRSIIDHRGAAPTSPLYALAHLGAARAAALAGDLDDARAAYRMFFTLWKEADQDLGVLTESRREHDRLQ
jgi:tetratricopeptide (TPR) repeat protein